MLAFNSWLHWHWLLRHIISISSFLLTILFVSFILRSKRPPGSTSAWLLFITLIPYVGIPFYILFSVRKVSTKLQKKETLFETKQLNSSASEPLSSNKAYQSFETFLARTGNPPARMNPSLHLLSNGELAYRQILELIEGATKTIHLTTFIFADDIVGRSILQLLTFKAQKGVKVRLLLDSLGTTWVKKPNFDEFRAASGEVGYFMPLFHLPLRGRANLRNHRKALIVDSQKAVLGGMNVALEYMGPEVDTISGQPRWVDLALEIQGPSVTDIERIFEKDWKFATQKNIETLDPKGDPKGEPNSETSTIHTEAQAQRIQIVASGPDVMGDSLYDSLLTLIYQAKTRLWIATPYFIPDESLAKALQLSAQRGVDVKVLIPEKSNHPLADLARGSYVKQLVAQGCQFYFLPKMMHAKAFIIDQDFALTGSANFDMRSLLYNYEVGTFISSVACILELETWFKKQFSASIISTSVLGEPAFWTDLAQGVGRVLGPLI